MRKRITQRIKLIFDEWLVQVEELTQLRGADWDFALLLHRFEHMNALTATIVEILAGLVRGEAMLEGAVKKSGNDRKSGKVVSFTNADLRKAIEKWRRRNDQDYLQALEDDNATLWNVKHAAGAWARTGSEVAASIFRGEKPEIEDVSGK